METVKLNEVEELNPLTVKKTSYGRVQIKVEKKAISFFKATQQLMHIHEDTKVSFIINTDKSGNKQLFVYKCDDGFCLSRSKSTKTLYSIRLAKRLFDLFKKTDKPFYLRLLEEPCKSDDKVLFRLVEA